jgi:nitrous oxidase accessory protein NosD
MTGNRFEDNWGAAAYGLLLKEITDSEITGNRVPAQHGGRSTPRAARG